jgi:hypothetical protein
MGGRDRWLAPPTFGFPEVAWVTPCMKLGPSSFVCAIVALSVIGLLPPSSFGAVAMSRLVLQQRRH